MAWYGMAGRWAWCWPRLRLCCNGNCWTSAAGPLLTLCCAACTAPRRYYALLAERFAKLKREYADAFSEAFVAQYQLIHRLETNKLRNTAKLFAHLLSTDAIPWAVLQVGCPCVLRVGCSGYGVRGPGWRGGGGFNPTAADSVSLCVTLLPCLLPPCLPPPCR